MPVLQSSVRIDRNNYIFSNRLTGSRSPSQLRGGHGLVHGSVELVGHLACEDVVDFDGAIVATLRQVLVVRVESNAEGLVV
jgi:hypothetical protein